MKRFYVKSKLSENISKTPEGFLLCRNVLLTHTGKLKYQPGEHPFEDFKGEVTITRSPEELFSEATIASFQGKPITIEHPDEFVDSKNYKELANGTVLNVRKASEPIEIDGEQVEGLMADFLITVEEAIKEVENGLREVSLGYDALWSLIDETNGVGVHEEIRGNHCALVENGRAGIKCAINDHKKENIFMDLKEKFKKLFGKTVDEAVAEKEKEAADEAAKAEADKKAADEAAKKAADEAAAKEKEEKEKASKDEGSLEDRVSKIEGMLTKILEKLEGKSEDEDQDDEDAEDIVADEEDESEDEESEENLEGSEDEIEDEESEEESPKKKVGDSKKKTSVSDALSKAEILAPGIKDSKDLKKKALEVAYKTADGKKVIDTLTGGKGISKLTKDAEEAVFNAAAEMLKTKRVNDFASARVTTIDSFPALKGAGAKTADDINKQNADFYSKKQ